LIHTSLFGKPSVAMATINGGNIHPPVQQEKVNTDIVTLTRFLTEEQAKHPEATGDFTYVGF
jgi:fructose-1,6-bisphosphatase I